MATSAVFATGEKALKEFWVMKETSSKSFRTFLNVMNDSDTIKVVCDEKLNVIFYNEKFKT
jgi:hypothetical protein